MPLVNSSHLRTFIAVASAGSFSGAARVVHVSQSTVSLHVRQLEETLGTRLLDRDPVQPTPAGQVLLRYASKLLHLEQEAAEQVQHHAGDLPTSLSLGASTPAAAARLSLALASIRAEHPGLQVRVKGCSGATAVSSLVAGDCDLAVVQGHARHDDVDCHEIGQVSLVVVGRPDRVADGFVCCEDCGGLPDGATPWLQVSSAWAVRAYLLAGCGLGLLAQESVAHDLASGALEVVPWEGTPRQVPLLAGRARARPAGDVVKRLVGALRT